MAIKQVVVVRTDLDMGKGKIAAQVGHACVLGAEHVRKSNPEWFSEWWEGCLLYTSPSPRDGLLSRMPSSA